MNLFQIILVMMAALIVAVWVGNLPGEIKKLKNKEKEFLVSDKMLSENEKQKIREEEYVNFLNNFREKEKIYITSQGTVLNSKPHTFKDFINNQKLPSKLELTWDILAKNNITVPGIIRDFEEGEIYPQDTKVAWKKYTIKVDYNQMVNMKAIKLSDNMIVIDKNYPIGVMFYIKPLTVDFNQTDFELRTFDVDVTFQVGNGWDD